MSDPFPAVATICLVIFLCVVFCECCLLAVAVVVAFWRSHHISHDDGFNESAKEAESLPTALPTDEWDATDGRWRRALVEDEEEGE